MSSARSPRRGGPRFKKHFIRRLSSWLVLSTALTVLVGKALNDVQAAGVYWDINGSTPGASGGGIATGIWDASNPFWNDASGIGSGAIWASGDTAIFAAGGNATGTYSVTVIGTQGIGGITFEDGFVTLGGGTLQMTANATFEVTALLGTVSSTVTGGFDLIKAGTGTLVLDGTNSYTGRTVINSGTLSISADTNLGAAPGAFASDNISFTGSSTLQITGASNPTLGANRGIAISPTATATVQVLAAGNTVTYGGVISGGADTTFRKSGPGTLNLSASSSLSGTLNIDGGTLRLASNGAFASAVGVVLGNRGVFTLDNTAANVGDRTAGAFSSAGGTINFIGNAAATTETLGALTLNAGALTINTSPGAGGSTLTIPSVTRNPGGTLYLNGTGLGSGTNQVILSTAPALTNSILKYAVVNNGTLASFATYTTSSGVNQSVLPLPLASHNQGAETTWVAANNVRPTADVTLTASRSAYSLTLDSGIDILAPTSDRTLTLGGGVLQTGGVSQVFGTSTLDNIFAFGANEALFHIIGSLQLDRGNTTSLSGTGGFTKSGAGILILNGVSTLSVLTGAFNVNEGILELRGGTSLMTTAVNVNLNGGTLRLSNNSSTTYTGTWTVVADSLIQVDRVTAAATATTHTIGALTMGGGRVLSVNSNDITSGTAYGLTTGALTLAAGGSIFDVANNGAGIGTLTVGTITGAFPITKTGAGDLLTGSTISGFSSPVDIQAGRIGWSGISGTITESQTFSGAGGLFKTGDSIVTLTGTNTFTGGVAVTDGTLRFSTVSDNGGLASNLGQGTDGISLIGGSTSSNLTPTLSFVGSLNQSTNRVITVTGGTSTIDASGTGGATITFTGAINTAGNILNLSGTGAGFITGGVIQSSTAADLSVNSGTWTISGTPLVIADDVFSIGATAVLNLNTVGILTYTTGTSNGLYMRSGGTVVLNASDVNGVANSGGLDFLMVGESGAGIFNTNGFNITVPRFDVGDDDATIDTGTVTGNGTISTADFNLYRGTIMAKLAGAGAVEKFGVGTLTLMGDNSGLTSATAVRIDAGNLVLDYTVSNTDKLRALTGIDMRGGTLTVTGSTTTDTTQTVALLTLAGGGQNAISVNSSPGFSATLNLGAITRGALANDGTMRFTLPANGSIITTSGNNNATAMGILGGWATIDTGTTLFFARNDGSNRVAAANSVGQDAVNSWVAGDNVSDVAGFTGVLANGIGINSLRFDANGASPIVIAPDQVLGIASGGILMTNNVSTGVHTISGGLLASGTSELIFIQESVGPSLSVATSLLGSTGVTKAGNGMLVLTGNNTFFGPTDLQAGSLIASGGNAIGDLSIVTLADDRATTLQILGSETIGALAGGNAATGYSFGAVDFGANTLTLQGGATFGGTFVGTGTIVKNSALNGAAMNLTGATTSSFTGSLIVNSGTVTLSGSQGRLNGATSVTINKSGAFYLDNSDDSAPNDRLSDSAAFILHSADGAFVSTTIPRGLAIQTNNGGGEDETIGVLTFGSGTSYLSGETTATGGNASIIADNFVRTNNATVNARGRALGAAAAERNQFKIGTAANQTAFIGTSDNANLVGGGGAAGTKIIDIVPWAIGEVTTGTIADTNMGNSLVTYVTDTGFRPLDFATEYNTFATRATVTDNIRESRTTDLTNIASAVLNALVLHNNNTTTSAIKFSGTGPGQTLAITSGALLFTLNSAAVSPSIHQITLEGFDAGITMGGAGVTSEYVIHVVNPSSAANAPTFTASINSPLTASADLTKSGRGTLILTASNTAGGGVSKTTLNEGTLQIGSLANIGGISGGLVFAGGALQLAPTFNAATNDLSTRSITFLPGGGTIDTNGVNPTFSNALGSGSGTFTKAGAGNLTLNAGTSLTGGTVIAGGTITLGVDQAIGSGDLTVAAGATLALGAFHLTVANVTLPASDTAALTGTGTLTSAGTVTVNQGTVTPVLAGSMNLVKQTAAQTAQLDGVSSYTGFTHIQNGVLRLGSMANAGVNSPIGAPTGDNAAIRLGNATTTGTLQYSGGDGDTNRRIWLTGTTGGGIIDNDGSGILTLNGDILSVEGGAKTLTLQGTSPGTSVLNGIITDNVGTVTLTKAEAGTWRLNGVNRHSGGTNINAGKLIAAVDGALGTGNVTFGGTGTLDNNNANRTFANNFVLNGASGTLTGTGNFSFTGNWSSIGSGRTLFVANTGTTTFGDSNTDTITIGETDTARTFVMDVASTASAIVNATIQSGVGTGADGFTKTGAGSLTINAANTYSGATILDGGLVTFAVDQNLAASTNTLVIGSSSSSTTNMVLDLTNANATFGGSMLVQTNSATPNEIKIGATKTLTINNNVTLGSAGGGVTAINFTGGGSMVVNNSASGSLFSVGGITSSGNKSTADLSGLGSLTITLNTTDGVMRVNPTSSTNVTDKYSVLILPSTGAGTTTVTAAILAVGDSGVNNDTAAPFEQINQLKLGSGVNTFNVSTVNIATGTRDVGSITFNTATGSLVLQGTSGGPVTFNMGTGTSSTSAGGDNVFDVSGHNANLNLGVVNIGTQLTRIAALTNFFAFDQGTLVMQSLNLSSRNTAGGTTSTFNIGGGTVTSGPITMATTGAAAGLAVAHLNITGGSVTLSGSIVKGGGLGNDTANFSLNGATAVLDLGGFTLGGAGAAALDSIVIGAGTLKNVAEINGGATLVKTTSGTLTMDGTNTYTGANDFQNGTVILAGGGNNRISTGATTLGSGANSTVLQLGNAAGATSQTMSLLTIAGTGTAHAIIGGSSSYSTLTLNVSTNTSYDIAFGGAGANQNNFNLVKTGAGEMTLTGVANTYTGATTVSGGKLLVENLGGFSTTSAGLTIADGTEFTLRGTGLTGDVSYGFGGGAGNKVTIGSGSGTAILGFRLDGAFNTQLKLLAGQTLTVVTGSILQTAVYVDDAPIAGHGYVLIDGASAGALHAGGGIFDFNPVVFNGGSFSYALSNVTAGGVDRWVITPTAVPAASDVWWKGDLTGIATAVWSASLTSGTGFPTNWDTSQSGGVDAAVPPDSGSIVHFSATGAANLATTLGANLAIQELIFHPGGTAVSIDGNVGLYALTLGNTVDASGITMMSGAPNVSISADLVLAQNQSFNITDAASILTISGSMGGPGTLGINDNGSSLGRLILTGGGGVATYSGTTNLVAGRLVLNGGANNRLPITTNLTMGNATLGAVLQLGDAINGATNQTIGSLNTGAATSNSIVGGAGPVSTLTVNQDTAGTFRGIIGGAGANENNIALVKQGTATLVLAGANTYLGGTTVNNGTLQLGATGTIVGALTINAQAGATATFDNNSRTTVLTGGLTFGGGDSSSLARLVNTGGGGSFTIGGNILYDGTNNPQGASIEIPIDLGNVVRTITVNDSTTAAVDLLITASLNVVAGTNGTGLTLDGTGTAQISAPIVLPGGGDNSASDLTKNGTGTWIISSAISMSDDVAHNAGTITITGAGARITVGDDFVTDNATVVTNLNVIDAIQGTSSTSNGLYARSGATINVNANGAIGALMELIVLGDDNQGTGNLVMNADASIARLDLGFNSSTEIGNVTGTGTLSGLSTINLNNGIVSANLAGTAGNIVKDNFTVTLSGNNSLGTGTTAVNSGNLVLDYTPFAGTNSKIGTGILTMGSTVSSDGTALLTLTGNPGAASIQNVAGLASAGGPSTIAINAAPGFDTVLRVTGSFTQTGGTINLVLANANSRLEYTGAAGNTNGIIGGWLTIASNRFATILESGAVDVVTAVTNSVKNDVTTWNPGDNVINSAAFTGSVPTTARLNSITFDAAAASNVAFGDYLILQSGGLLLTSNVGASNSTITAGRLVSESGAIFIHQYSAGILTIAASILEKAPVTKTGDGTLVLSGANLLGQLNIDGGTVRVSGGDALSDTATVDIRNVTGATLEIAAGAANSETMGSLAGDGAAAQLIIGTGATLTINQSAAETFAGIISGGGDFVKQGASALTITGDASLTGAVTINAGRITLSGAAGRLNEAASYTVNGGELLIVQDQSSNQDRLRDSGTITLNNTGGTIGLKIQNTNQNATRVDNIGPIVLGTGHNVITAEAGTGTGTGTSTIADLLSDSLSRGSNRATLLVSGLDLGSSATTRKGYIRFDSAATTTLNGFEVGGTGGAGTTSIPIIPWMIGDLTTAGFGNTFVTYVDGTTGLRPLAVSEFINDSIGITGALTNNIRFTGTAAITATPTAINSLVLDAASAIALTGSASAMEITTGSILAAGAGNHSVGAISALTTGGGRDYTIFVTTAASTFTVDSPLTSVVPLVKSGAGTLKLTNVANGFTDTYLNQGTVLVNDYDKLGSGGLYFAGGILKLDAGFADDLGVKAFHLLTGGGTIDIGALSISATNLAMSGTGTLTKIGAGTLTVGDSAALTHTGLWNVGGGTILLNNALGNVIGPGGLLMTSSVVNTIVRLNMNDQIADTAIVDLRAVSGISQLLDLNNKTDTIGGLFVSSATTAGATVKTGATGVLTVNGDIYLSNNRQADASTTEFQVLITGSGAIGSRATNGVLDLGGANRRITVETSQATPTRNDALIETVIRNGGIIKEGSRVLYLRAANTYAGKTQINAGTITITAANNLGDGSATNTIGIANGATLRSSGTNVDLGVNRSIALSGATANIEVDSATVLTVSGVVTGDQRTTLVKNGAGTLALAAANTFTGATSVNAGELVVAGSLAGDVNLSAGATSTILSSDQAAQVAGIVALSSATSGAVVDPGRSGGSGTSTIGALTADGNVTLGTTGAAFSAQLKLEIGGTVAGTSYDQMNVTAGRTVSLGNVALSLAAVNGYQFTLPSFLGDQMQTDGAKFFVLTLGAGSTLSGTFQGTNLAGDPQFPGYSTITLGGQLFAINYTADFDTNNFSVGSGNDVALMAIPEPNVMGMLAGSLGLALGLQRFRRRPRLN